MNTRQNFYKAADGSTKKYIYCACSAGPFKEEDIFDPKTGTGTCIVVGQHVAFCLNCAKLRGISFKQNTEDDYEPKKPKLTKETKKTKNPKLCKPYATKNKK